MAMRFYTYHQNIDHIKACSVFLDPNEVDLTVGGNMARLMGVQASADYASAWTTRSASISVGRLVLARGTTGIIDASAT